MKNFIFFLGEESKSPIHASKSWVDIAGNFSPVRHAGDPLDIHHLHMVVDNPEKFGTTHQELEKIDPEEYKRLKNRTLTWSEGILKHVGNRGHMRVVRRGNAVAIEHHGADNFDPSHFVNAVKKIKKTIGRKGVVDISLVGPIPNNPREQPYSKWITSMSELNDFIGEKGGSTLKSVTSAPEVSSTELRAMQPKKPPSDMPRFLFKNMFTIGDSFIPYMLKSLNEARRVFRVDPNVIPAGSPTREYNFDEIGNSGVAGSMSGKKIKTVRGLFAAQTDEMVPYIAGRDIPFAWVRPSNRKQKRGAIYFDKKHKELIGSRNPIISKFMSRQQGFEKIKQTGEYFKQGETIPGAISTETVEDPIKYMERFHKVIFVPNLGKVASRLKRSSATGKYSLTINKI